MSRAGRGRRRAGRGALVLIAALLTSSGLIRLGDGIGQVMALEVPVPEAEPGKAGIPQPGTEVSSLLAALQARETDLAKDEAAIVSRKQALALAEEKISARLAELVAAEKTLSATLALADQAAEQDLTQLTAVYESMKPKDAALLFEEMEPDFAAGFLARMQSDSAAGVMAGLAPKTAYAVSVVLAGRNANVPKE